MTAARNAAAVRETLRTYALTLPDAYEDHPWGESVAKVRKKIFVFFGTDGSDEPGLGMKLSYSQPMALAQPGVTPSGYGLGKAGWVSIRISTEMPFQMLREWIDESYRAVAPKALAAQVGESPDE
ncbi:MAG: MmcQ/YjbR family DNA-binding protein [Candidatus Limnocylindrales bacterium]